MATLAITNSSLASGESSKNYLSSSLFLLWRSFGFAVSLRGDDQTHWRRSKPVIRDEWLLRP